MRVFYKPLYKITFLTVLLLNKNNAPPKLLTVLSKSAFISKKNASKIQVVKFKVEEIKDLTKYSFS